MGTTTATTTFVVPVNPPLDPLSLLLGALETSGPALLEADADPPGVDGNSPLGLVAGSEVDVDVTKIVDPSCERVMMISVLLAEISGVVVVSGGSDDGVVVVMVDGGSSLVVVLVLVVLLLVGSDSLAGGGSNVVSEGAVSEGTRSGAVQSHWSWIKYGWESVRTSGSVSCRHLDNAD
jgi:hypothetical protein